MSVALVMTSVKQNSPFLS